MLSYLLWTAGCGLMLFTVIPEAVHLLHGIHSIPVLTLVVLCIVLQALGYGMINPIQCVFVADQFLPSQVKILITCAIHVHSLKQWLLRLPYSISSVMLVPSLVCVMVV